MASSKNISYRTRKHMKSEKDPLLGAMIVASAHSQAIGDLLSNRSPFGKCHHKLLALDTSAR
jgi:hypothetical protein